MTASLLSRTYRTFSYTICARRELKHDSIGGVNSNVKGADAVPNVSMRVILYKVKARRAALSQRLHVTPYLSGEDYPKTSGRVCEPPRFNHFRRTRPSPLAHIKTYLKTYGGRRVDMILTHKENGTRLSTNGERRGLRRFLKGNKEK